MALAATAARTSRRDHAADRVNTAKTVRRVDAARERDSTSTGERHDTRSEGQRSSERGAAGWCPSDHATRGADVRGGAKGGGRCLVPDRRSPTRRRPVCRLRVARAEVRAGARALIWSMRVRCAGRESAGAVLRAVQDAALARECARHRAARREGGADISGGADARGAGHRHHRDAAPHVPRVRQADASGSVPALRRGMEAWMRETNVA
jgi:hypothetical protein